MVLVVTGREAGRMMATMYGWRDGVRGRVAAGVWALALVAGVGAGAVTGTPEPGVPVEGGGYDQPAGAVELDAAEEPATPAVGTVTSTTVGQAAPDVSTADEGDEQPVVGDAANATAAVGPAPAPGPTAPVVVDPPTTSPPAATTTTTTTTAPPPAPATSVASTLPEPPPTTTPCCGLP